jgi:hypothetical protein
MEPFTAALSYPDNGTTSEVTSSARTFSFKFSNTDLWSSSCSNYFYFSLFIKDKTGDPVYYGEFRYSFSSGVWQIPGSYDRTYGTASWTNATALSSGVSYSSGTVSVDLTNTSVINNDDSYVSKNYGSFGLTSGSTYEWDVFGSWMGTSEGDLGTYYAMYPTFFVKVNSSSSGSGYGVSYANTELNGEGSTNGSFAFSY